MSGQGDTRPGHRPTRLPEDKRWRILDAAIREFAEEGYEKASTNAIAKEAGIAKGLLFHHFGSKKDLFLWVFDYCVDHYLQYFLDNLGELPPDLLDRLIKWATLKVRTLAKDPLMYRLSVTAVQDVPDELKPDLMRRYTEVSGRLMPVFLKDIDFSRLRKGLDPQRAVQFALLALNGVAEKFLAASREQPDKGLADLQMALREIEEYADMLRYGLYRRGP